MLELMGSFEMLELMEFWDIGINREFWGCWN